MGLLSADEQTFYLTGGGSSDGFLDDAWRLDLSTLAWESLPGPPLPLLRATAIRHEDDVYVFGGTTSGLQDIATHFRWSLVDHSWTELSPSGSAPSPRYKHMAVAVDDQIWLLGGKYDDEEPARISDELWQYSLTTQQWTLLSPSGGPGPIYRHAMAWDPDRRVIWVHGGYDGSDTRQDWFWALAVDTLEWTELDVSTGPPLRASHTIALTPAGVLIWGGNGSDEATWLYDPESMTWSSIDDGVAPRARDAQVADITADRQQLWLVGGDPVSEDVPDFVSDVWRFDVTQLRWEELISIEE